MTKAEDIHGVVAATVEQFGGVGTLTVQIAKAFGARGHRRLQYGDHRYNAILDIGGNARCHISVKPSPQGQARHRRR